MRFAVLLIGWLAGQCLVPTASWGQGTGGRPLSALSRQMLDFGTLFSGTPASVSRFDALHAGQFELRGAKGTEVRVDLGLPPVMTAAGGAKLPLKFTAGDGGYARDGIIATASPFDPRAPLVTTLSENGRLYLFLGGTATPAAKQSAGTYAGTVTVTIAYTGS
ncbi:MAG TPA: DUF4402 domain-containing protein [Gemmatimonadales bacterium]|nr:DUF4402 domain-containing protein [Gemmatimonadales bacterium]